MELVTFKGQGNVTQRVTLKKQRFSLLPLKKIILTKIIYGLPLLLLTNFELALPSRGYSTDPSEFY